MKNDAAWKMAVNFEKLGAYASHKVRANLGVAPFKSKLHSL